MLCLTKSAGPLSLCAHTPSLSNRPYSPRKNLSNIPENTTDSVSQTSLQVFAEKASGVKSIKNNSLNDKVKNLPRAQEEYLTGYNRFHSLTLDQKKLIAKFGQSALDPKIYHDLFENLSPLQKKLLAGSYDTAFIPLSSITYDNCGSASTEEMIRILNRQVEESSNPVETEKSFKHLKETLLARPYDWFLTSAFYNWLKQYPEWAPKDVLLILESLNSEWVPIDVLSILGSLNSHLVKE